MAKKKPTKKRRTQKAMKPDASFSVSKKTEKKQAPRKNSSAEKGRGVQKPKSKTSNSKGAAKKTPAKKTPAKKTAAKKTPAKKTTAKKTPAKKVSKQRKIPSIGDGPLRAQILEALNSVSPKGWSYSEKYKGMTIEEGAIKKRNPKRRETQKLIANLLGISDPITMKRKKRFEKSAAKERWIAFFIENQLAEGDFEAAAYALWAS